MIEVRFHGRGGQGAVTAAELLARAAISEGRCAQGFPNFGPERRGAPVTAFLRVSDTPIRLREKIETPSVVVVLDASLLRLIDVGEGLADGGTVVVNAPPDAAHLFGTLTERFRVAAVDADRIAMETLGVPIANTAIIGGLIRAVGLTTLGALEGPLRNRFGRLADKNLIAMKTAHGTTVVMEAPVPGPKKQETAPLSYSDIIARQALHAWKSSPLGCDIETPGSSRDFRTGDWRTAGRPKTDRDACIRCGFCDIYCPDTAYRADAEGYYDWDGRYCKGCGICAEECPKGAIVMTEEA